MAAVTAGAPLTAGNTRVKEARKLSRRSVRTERRLFLADGPKAVEGALEVAGLRGRGLRDPRRHRAVRRRWPHAAPRWTAGRRPGAGLAQRQRDARPASWPSAATSTGRWPTCSTAAPAAGRALRRRPRPRQRRHRDPLRRRRRRRRGRARRALGRRLQPQDRARQRRQPLPPPAGGRAGPRGRGRAPRRPPGCRSWPPTAPARSTSTTPTSCWPGPPPGSSATRRGGCPPSSPRWPTTGSGSRSTAAPRASTCPPPPRCASTPRRAAQRGRTGVPEQRSVPDPAREALDALAGRRGGRRRRRAGHAGQPGRRPVPAGAPRGRRGPPAAPRCWPCRTRRARLVLLATGRTRGWSPAPPSPSSPGC